MNNPRPISADNIPPTAANRFARAALEADPARQLRRLRRLVTRRSVADELAAKVTGKRVLVTGASSGIGEAVAQQLILAGAEVLLVARRVERLDALVSWAAEHGQVAHAYPCDLSDEAAVARLAADVVARHGGVDILINNAGRSIRRSLADTSDRLHDFERAMRLNFFGMVWLTTPLVACMRTQGGGHVINISTMGTQFRGTALFSAYMASKAAMDQYAGSVAAETWEDGVAWTTVHLPLVQTDMIAPAARAWRTVPTLSLASGASRSVPSSAGRHGSPHRSGPSSACWISSSRSG